MKDLRLTVNKDSKKIILTKVGELEGADVTEECIRAVATLLSGLPTQNNSSPLATIGNHGSLVWLPLQDVEKLAELTKALEELV